MSYYIDDNIIEQIKEKVDIVQLINQYLPLKKSGGNFLGLCPFHTEKTPSFSVSEKNQFYHCFGCGAGGDIFEFVMHKENLDFIESVKFLADKYGVELREITGEEKIIKDKKDRYFKINRETARYFLNNLMNSKTSLDYLENRNISYKMARKFGLGYALDSWDGLYKYLSSKGYKETELEELGLIGSKKNNNGYYDKFRNRIIFPIIDTKSRVIGFGGRVLDDTMPKYLNSPETPVFNKGNNLYGLNMLDKYSNRERIILVEGYMDVISLFNNGIYSAVASLGTAFTNRQAQLIKRYGEKVYICYDSDMAGINATNRAIEVLLEEGIKPYIISLNGLKDPDEYFIKHNKTDFLNEIDKALNFMDFKISINKNKYNLNDIDGKIQFTKEISSELRLLQNPIERDVYINKLSEELNVDKDAIKMEVDKNYNKPSFKIEEKSNFIPPKVISQRANLTAEIELVRFSILDKDYYDNIKKLDIFGCFENETCKHLVLIINDLYITQDYIEKDKLYDIMQNRPDLDTAIFKKILEDDNKFDVAEIDNAIYDLVTTLKIKILQNERSIVSKKISEMDSRDNTSEEIKVLLEEKLRLDFELEKIRYKDRG